MTLPLLLVSRSSTVVWSTNGSVDHLRPQSRTPADEALASIKLEIEALGGRSIAIPLDVCSSQSITSSFEAIVNALGKIDILINAAGTSTRSLISGHPDELWNRMLDVNLTGPFRTIRCCLPGMIAQKWGRIVNFASTASHVGYPLYSAYCSSKAGLLGLTRCVALEGAPHGVTCNAICPGFVATDSCRSALQQEIAIKGLKISVERYQQQIMEGIPQKRFLTPEEVAGLAVFLCREEALGIEGEEITMAMGSQW